MKQNNEIIGAVSGAMKCDCCKGESFSCAAHKRGCVILQCNDCGLYFVSPQPSQQELEKLYSVDEGYFASAETDLSHTSSANAEKLHAVLMDLQGGVGRFHDVGCSSGKLMYHMQKNGWEVTGNDLNQGALDIARSNKLQVFYGTLEACNLEAESLDAVHLGDLIEHVRSPRMLLSEIRRILKVGGVVSIVTPNSECAFAKYSLMLTRWFGFGWVHSEAPYHLYEFTPTSLMKLAEVSGFSVEKIECAGEGSFAYMVGASGNFDQLKKVAKRDKRFMFKGELWRKMPALFGLTTLLYPFWIYGRMLDRKNNTGRSIRLWIRRTGE